MTESRVLNFDASLPFETAVKNAVEDMKNNPGTTLIIPPGRYTLSGKLSREAMRKLFAGEFGKNPQKEMFNPKYKYDIGLDLTGLRDVRILAYGAKLMVDGYMEPITISGCENVELCGITIDHIRKPYSKGKIENLREMDGKLYAKVVFDKGNEIQPGTPMGIRHVYVDPKDNRSLKAKMLNSTYISENSIIAEMSPESEIFEGALFYSIHSGHSRPGILVEKSKNIILRDVTIHSQPGMGIVGNRCENVYIYGLKVVPSGGDHVSTNSDATHFTSCTGALVFEDCEASWQGDDFTNVHAYFQAVVGKVGERTYYLQEKTPDGTHSQRLDYPDIGDTLELVSHASLEKLGEFIVERCEPMPNLWMCRVTLDKALPLDTDGLMLADITRLPRVVVRRCKITSHFARSILLKNRDSLVEDCIFENVQGPAVVAAAESWWYEGVCPANLTVRNNLMKNCSAFWGEASGVVVKADCKEPSGQSIYNVRIVGNRIESPGSDHGIYVRNVSGLVIRENEIISGGKPTVIENCSDINE